MAASPVSFLILLLTITGNAWSQDSVPTMNRNIIEYVNTVIGQKVDRGECWDLANQALNRVNASWDGQFSFGKPVDPARDTVYQGDIIQFEGVEVKYSKGNTFYRESYPQHTAIIYTNKGNGVYELAHQNTGFSGRKVGISTFDMHTVTRGKVYIYRPVKNDAP